MPRGGTRAEAREGGWRWKKRSSTAAAADGVEREAVVPCRRKTARGSESGRPETGDGGSSEQPRGGGGAGRR